LLLVVILDAGHVFQPPVWDTATGLFPAAIELSDSNFDIISLLNQPGWGYGGPNAHSLSIVTWLTAGLIWLFGTGSHLFFLLHCLHFVLAAYLLSALYRFARLTLPPLTSFLVCLATLFFPVFRVQTGYMYLELPLATSTVLALLSVCRNQWYRAALWTALAVAVKKAGLITAGTVGLAAVLCQTPWRSRLKRLVAILFIPSLLISRIAFRLIGSPDSQAPFSQTGELSYLTSVKRNVFGRLSLVPDLYWLLIFASVGSVLLSVWIAARLREGPSDHVSHDSVVRRSTYPVAVSLLCILIFSSFYLAAPATGVRFWMLPRYCTQVIPLLMFGFGWIGQDISNRVTATVRSYDLPSPDRLAQYLSAGSIGLICIFSLANARGQFYPPYKGTAFSLVERDLSYRKLLTVQRSTASATEELPEDVPKFYPRAMHYFLKYPALGYTTKPIENGHFILTAEPYNRGRLADFPERFFLIYSNHGHGGRILREVWKQASSHTGWVTKVFPVRNGGFVARIVEVTYRQ
jgi:hypothetical protein